MQNQKFTILNINLLIKILSNYSKFYNKWYVEI